MSVILFLLILTILVFVHEFGHFIVAKKSGIRVDEFGFGFPPRIFGIKKGETTYSINLIPFGGFVKIYGEKLDDETEHGPQRSRSMSNKPKGIQAAVLAAGVFFNLLFAWVLISIGFMTGLPTSASAIPNGAKLSNEALVVMNVVEGSPADKAGLKVGDKIESLENSNDKVDVKNADEMISFVSGHQGKQITVNYTRAGEPKTVNIVPQKGIIDGRGAIGVSLDTVGIWKLPFHKAFIKGFELTARITKDTTVSIVGLLKDAFRGDADIKTITGPVGIVGVVGDAYHFGFVYLLSFAALISINLAVINLIPIPALDGGRLLFVAIEAVSRKKIPMKIANTLNAVGFVLLILLMLVVTYNDIIKLIK